MNDSRAIQVEDPIPDFLDVLEDPEFIGVAWIPSVMLRWVEREEVIPVRPHVAKTKMTKVLQQRWETAVINQSGKVHEVINPNYNQWRDIPLEEETI